MTYKAIEVNIKFTCNRCGKVKESVVDIPFCGDGALVIDPIYHLSKTWIRYCTVLVCPDCYTVKNPKEN